MDLKNPIYVRQQLNGNSIYKKEQFMYVTSFKLILPRFFNFLQGTVSEKPPTQLKSKVAKFESDLLKTNEDGALQSREIFTTFVW